MKHIGISLLAIFAITGNASMPSAAGECIASASAYELGPTEARALYDCIHDRMVAVYRRARGLASVPAYLSWQVASSAPLVSATHGSMMVMHFANPVAAPLYLRWERMAGKRFPPGSVLAKESYRVRPDRVVVPGPLFLMEKAPPGTSPETADWIYTQVFTDGHYERTRGPGSERVAFCHDCHSATLDAFDAVFFPPEEFRVGRK